LIKTDCIFLPALSFYISFKEKCPHVFTLYVVYRDPTCHHWLEWRSTSRTSTCSIQDGIGLIPYL